MVKWAAKRRNLTLKQYARKRIKEYELYLSKPQTRKNKGVKRKRVIKALKTMKRVLKEVA